MALSDIQQALQRFSNTDFHAASLHLWETLGYKSDKQLDAPDDPQGFFESINVAAKLDRKRAGVDDWKTAQFLFQLTNDEIPSLAYGQMAMIVGDAGYQKGMIESFVFLVIELTEREWTRTQLAGMTRELNRAFPMPAIVLFRYGRLLSISVIDRRVNKRDATKDVIDQRRIAIVKDIDVDEPHRAHLEILNDLMLANVGERHTPSNFRDLYDSWMRVLSVRELNQRFYDELFTWYCWALKNTAFPHGQTTDSHGQPSVAVIRLLTRLIFVWFIKEKGAVPDDLFRASALNDLLKEPPDKHPDSSSYYQAILQNLFFATLNTEMADRSWKSEGRTADGKPGLTSHYMIHTVYRYRSQFRDAERAFDLFTRVPFLNGGLFECLDREVSARDLERTPDIRVLVEKEGRRQVLRVDGFSDRESVRLSVPNKLFFSPQGETVDLGEELRTKKGQRTARGLIDIFERYKFTIEENTPTEEEVALDPELLGKVFENLLASYNTDTELTARKQSGSFYTPREVVDYMVDESLVAYFETRLPRSAPEGGPLTPNNGGTGEKSLPTPAPPLLGAEGASTAKEDAPDTRLRALLAFGGLAPDFSPAETVQLISAIEDLKTLDPACGSGAFPMGMLQKLVHVLSKLDPNNTYWKAQNRAPLERQLKDAESIPDPTLRETKVEEATDALEKLDRAFSDKHYADYSRKLFLIEKCLFGVDIQPIAIQIAKLRFFISLIVSQKFIRDAPADNFNITPLPNLETKLAAANSLIPIERPVQGSLRDTRIDDKENELHGANERHFAARTTKTKRKWRDKITGLRDELADLLEQDSLLTKESAKQVVGWDPFDQNTSANFFDPEWMFGLRTGFDIVIGNPPYIKEYNFKDAFNGVRNSPYYQGKMDLWYLFACQSLDLLKEQSGVLSFIATNNWVTNSGASKLRQVIAKRATILKLVDFMDYKVFGSADIQTMILVARNSSEDPTYQFDLRRVIDPWATETEMQWLLRGVPHACLEYLTPTFDRNKFKDTTFTFSADQSETILQAMESVSRFFLDERTEVAQGIVAPQDNVNNKTASLLGEAVNVGDGIFLLTTQEMHDLALTEAEKKFVKPFYMTEQFRRYCADVRNRLWIIYTDSRFKDPSEMQPYPNLQRHLDRFRPVITSDNWPYGLHRARNEKFFTGEKIISLRKCSDPTFTFTDFDCYVSQTFNIIKTSRIDLRYLTAILNSTVVRFWLRYRGKMQGKLFQVDKEPLLAIPIINATLDQQLQISRLVRALIGAAGPHGHMTADAVEIDHLLNGLVYELYFPDQLHATGICLFQQIKGLELGTFDGLSGATYQAVAKQLVSTIFKNDHPIYRMLFDLQALPTVRIIEGKE